MAAPTVRATAEDLWPSQLLISSLYSLCSIPLTSNALLKTAFDIQFPFYMAPTVKSTVLCSGWRTDPNSCAAHPSLSGPAPTTPGGELDHYSPSSMPVFHKVRFLQLMDSMLSYEGPPDLFQAPARDPYSSLSDSICTLNVTSFLLSGG